MVTLQLLYLKAFKLGSVDLYVSFVKLEKYGLVLLALLTIIVMSMLLSDEEELESIFLYNLLFRRMYGFT